MLNTILLSYTFDYDISMKHAYTEVSESKPENEPDNAPLKVKAAIILELLKKCNIGKSHNDLSKIAKLISFLTGNSINNIYNILRKGITFDSEFHEQNITTANQILKELNSSIIIDINETY